MYINNIDRNPYISNNERDCVMTGPSAVMRRLYNPYTQTDSSTLTKDKPAVTENAFDQKTIDPVEAHFLARNAFLNYFKNTFAETEDFKKVFGSKTWNDIADFVISDLQLHRNKVAELAIYKSSAYVFTAEVDGMSGEVVLDKKTGSAKLISVDPS
jgi:hypothetical protein